MKKLKGLAETVYIHEVEISELKTEQAKINERIDVLSSEVQTSFDPDVTLVAINAPYYSTEDPHLLAKHLLKACNRDDKGIARATRTPERNNKPGVLKIQLKTRQDKIDVLRNKSNLRNSAEFKNVYLRTSKSHSDRLMELNMKTLLNEIPNGEQYRIAGNGRLVMKEQVTMSGSQSQVERTPITQNQHNRTQSYSSAVKHHSPLQCVPPPQMTYDNKASCLASISQGPSAQDHLAKMQTDQDICSSQYANNTQSNPVQSRT